MIACYREISPPRPLEFFTRRPEQIRSSREALPPFAVYDEIEDVLAQVKG